MTTEPSATHLNLKASNNCGDTPITTDDPTASTSNSSASPVPLSANTSSTPKTSITRGVDPCATDNQSEGKGKSVGSSLNEASMDTAKLQVEYEKLQLEVRKFKLTLIMASVTAIVSIVGLIYQMNPQSSEKKLLEAQSVELKNSIEALKKRKIEAENEQVKEQVKLEELQRLVSASKDDLQKLQDERKKELSIPKTELASLKVEIMSALRQLDMLKSQIAELKQIIAEGSYRDALKFKEMKDQVASVNDRRRAIEQVLKTVWTNRFPIESIKGHTTKSAKLGNVTIPQSTRYTVVIKGKEYSEGQECEAGKIKKITWMEVTFERQGVEYNSLNPSLFPAEINDLLKDIAE